MNYVLRMSRLVAFSAQATLRPGAVQQAWKRRIAIQDLSRKFSSVTNAPPAPASSSVKSTKKLIRNRPAPLVVSASAAKRLTEMLEGKEDTLGIRLSVRKRGCNGYSYTMNYTTAEEQSKRKDEVVEANGVKVFIDPAAVFYIVGTEMNYEETEISAEFTFSNPNSKGKCGCGESFNV